MSLCLYLYALCSCFVTLLCRVVHSRDKTHQCKVFLYLRDRAVMSLRRSCEPGLTRRWPAAHVSRTRSHLFTSSFLLVDRFAGWSDLDFPSQFLTVRIPLLSIIVLSCLTIYPLDSCSEYQSRWRGQHFVYHSQCFLSVVFWDILCVEDIERPEAGSLTNYFTRRLGRSIKAKLLVSNIDERATQRTLNESITSTKEPCRSCKVPLRSSDRE